ARRGEPAHPDELRSHDFALYIGSPRTLAFRRGAGAKAGATVVDIQARFQANNSEVLREVVLSGAGVGLLPDFSLRNEDAGHLLRVLPAWSVQGYFCAHIVAVRPFSPRVPLAVHCFVEHLQQVCSASADHRAW